VSSAPATIARNAVASLEALLLADFALWHAARYSAPTAVLLIAAAGAPWLAIAPSLWRGNRRRHAWATLLTAPYLTYGMMEMLANAGARAWAGTLVLTAFALFVALTAFLRLSRPTAPAPT
jgi:uncharacterized membrane protein